jgi:hypothetical protein
MGDPLLLQPEIQVGVGEAALSPMLPGDDVARLRREVGVPFAEKARWVDENRDLILDAAERARRILKPKV